MIKVIKSHSPHQLNSHYFVSGLNIKKIINKQFQASISETHANFIRNNRKEKLYLNQSDTHKSKVIDKQNLIKQPSLPSKTFKIRSFTKRLKNRENSKLEEATEIFQKVQNLRNFKSVNNRLDLLNYSRDEKRQEKNEANSLVQTKMKEILKREAAIKCKVSPQIFISENIMMKTPNVVQRSLLRFQQFNSELYRKMAHKIQVFLNPQREQNSAQTLIIVSLESFQLKKGSKTSMGEDKNSKSYNFSLEMLELFKMLSFKFSSCDSCLLNTKIAYKVKDETQLQELRQFLNKHKIEDYHSIFYPITKYVEEWNLFQIDSLLENIQQVIYIEAKYRLQREFPILTQNTPILFIPTTTQTLVTMAKTLLAIKHLLYEQHTQSNKFNTEESAKEQQFNSDFEEIKAPTHEFKSQNKFLQISYTVKEEDIHINTSELKQKLIFLAKRNQFKQCIKQKRKICTSKKIANKRRVLCERSSNISQNCQALIASKSYFEQISDSCEVQKPLSLEQLKEELLQNMKDIKMSGQNSQKKYDLVDRGDVQFLTNEISGFNTSNKAVEHIVAQLVRQNSHISKQISSYYTNVALLKNNFSQHLNEHSSSMLSLSDVKTLHIHLFKIC